VALLVSLAEARLLSGAHDLSGGGLGVALARLAIASGLGAEVALESDRPGAALFGERGGRALVALPAALAPELARRAAEADVPAHQLGRVTGRELRVRASATELSATLEELEAAWTTPF
jgi:phosphoribosylformylglycinamidine synthase